MLETQHHVTAALVSYGAYQYYNEYNTFFIICNLVILYIILVRLTIEISVKIN